MTEIEKILQRKNEIESELMDLKKKLYLEISRLPMIYGRCIKEIKCCHQSDSFSTDDSTTINVGDVIKFFKYPLYDKVIFYVCSDEYFTVPYSKEYFDFFTSEEDCAYE